MNLSRSLLTPLLVALLVLTSTSLAVARAAPDAAGQMVLCTGSGPVVVSFDENGDPVGPAHYCPDCAMTLLAAVAGYNPALEQAFGVTSLVFAPVPKAAATATVILAHARDPPLVGFSNTF